MTTKKFIFILTAAMSFAIENTLAQSGNEKVDETNIANGKVVMLNQASFLKKVWNYKKNETEWVYEGKLPCIIDFYADWCGPCKRVSPILAELAKEYAGKIIVYKIDTEKERELASIFGVRSIPAFLFVPTKGKPMSDMGARSREYYEEIIKEYLLKTE